MSQAEELLNMMSSSVSVHSHPVPDTDTYFTIDPITRKIENTNRKKAVVMQYDHNSERFTFELPRYVDGHDMLECTSITVNVDNIGLDTDAINSDATDMTDLRINPKNPDTVISSWLISRNLTQLAGILSFSIEYKCVDASGNVVYEWSTDIFNEVEVRARKKNGEAAVIEHTDLLEQWRTQIFGAGDSVMANIAAEGEAQVEAVKTESETQQEAVELKGAQTLDSIPEDYTEVDAMADEAVRTKGDAIVCEASSEAIALNDSSNDYIRGLKLFGKSSQVTTKGYQLFDASKLPSKELHGCSVTNNGDGSFTISGSDMLSGDFTWYKDYTHEETVSILKSGELFFNVEKTTYPYLYISIKSDNGVLGEITNITDTDIKRTITKEMLDDETAYLRIGFWGAINRPLVPGTIKPILYQAGDGTWEPYTGGKPAPNPDYPQELASIEKPNVIVCGKNLWNHDYDITNIHNISGWGTAIWRANDVVKVLKPSTTYTLSFEITCISIPEHETVFSDNCGFVLYSGNENGEYVEMAMDTGNGVFAVGETRRVSKSFKTPSNVKDPTLKYEILRYAQRLITADGKPVHAVVSFDNMQLEEGTVGTEYEKYNGGEFTLTHTLPGIPVTSDGNYTDENGKQWICDEIDLERGVYVQRVANIVVNETSDVRINVAEDGKTNGYAYRYFLNLNNIMINSEFIMCDRLIHKNVNTLVGNSPENVGIAVSPVYSCIYLNINQHMTEDTVDACKAALANYPLTVNYILATPIETPLTAEEITAFKALRTNYPNTTILNDAGAWMSVKYNADTKTYVENPKILKLTDSSTGVVYELKIVDGTLTVVPV